MNGIEQREVIKKIKLDPIKIQPTDLEKVAAEVKVIQIKVYIKGVIDRIVDWDLEDDQTRPIDVADELIEGLKFEDEDKRNETLRVIEDIICREIMKFVDTTLSQQESIAKKKKITMSTIA